MVEAQHWPPLVLSIKEEYPLELQKSENMKLLFVLAAEGAEASSL